MKSLIIFLLALIVLSTNVFGVVYEIASCTNATNSLENVTDDLAGTYNIMVDLDCPIIGCITGSTAFTGIFDGKNHSISNLVCTCAAENCAIFGKVQADGIIRNVEFLNVSVIAGSNNIVGALIGDATNSTISQVYIDGTFSGTGGLNIGMIGYIATGGTTIIDVYSNLTITGFDATTNRCGGICGNCHTFTQIVNSYAAGNSGACDGINNFAAADINDSFSIGFTTGAGIGKGLCGGTHGCYWDKNLTNATAAGDATGTIVEISNNDTYWTSPNKAGWAPFTVWNTSIWKLDKTGLPIFHWQYEAPSDAYPTWSHNGTYSPPFYTGDTIYTYVLLSDDDMLSHFIFSHNTSGIWINTSANNISSNVTYNSTTFLFPITDGNLGWKWYFNDSANQWNSTDIFSALVLDKYPQWSNLSQSSDTSYQAVPVTVYSTWDDDVNMSHWKLYYYNTTHWENSTYYNFSYSSCTTDYNTECLLSYVLTSPMGIGNWSWYFTVNDTLNQTNTTDKMNFTVTPDPHPQWSNNLSYYAPFFAGDTIYTTAFLSDNVEISHVIFSTNGSIVAGDWSFSAPSGWWNETPEPIYNETVNATYSWVYNAGGAVGWKLYFNDSFNNWNVTDEFTFNIGYLPGEATITDWEITPCFTSEFGRLSWQLGENFTLYVNVTGNTSQAVQARIIFYYNETNATGLNGNQTDSGWFGYYNTTPPYRFTFSFEIFNVTSNSTIVIMARDTFNNTFSNVTDWFSVVSYGGKIEGECTTSMGYVIKVVEPEEEMNILIGAFWTLARVSNMGLVIFWIFLMATVSITLWIYMHSQPFLAAGLVLGTNAILAFVGVRIEALTTPMFFILILFLVVTGIIIFKKQVMGS